MAATHQQVAASEPRGAAEPVAEPALRDAAEQLGEQMLRHAQRAKDGSLYWLKPAGEAASVRGALGPYLHSGYAGIALFLAALGKVTGEERFSDAAVRGLIPLQRQLGQLIGQPESSTLKLGAVTGIGSLLYAFLRVGRWLARPDFVATACEGAVLVTPARVAADGYHDVMYGSAGALLVLLRLEEEAPFSVRARVDPLARAIACGEQLLEAKSRKSAEPDGWPSLVQPAGAGVAHGASGIALALAQLARRTGREDFLAAALDGLQFERLHFDEQIDNWWPVRFQKVRILLNAWCNGAAGIALVRAHLLDHCPSAALAEDLRLALLSLERASAARLDNLCCGNFGRADILLEISRRQNRSDLLADARRIARSRVAAAQENGSYETPIPGTFAPGFYTGLAGIGYALLRLSGASDLPCALAVD